MNAQTAKLEADAPPQILAVQNLSKAFGENVVLRDVSLTFNRAEIHGLIGENGAGKSTLMKILGGYQPPSSGELLLDGKPVHFISPKQAEARGIVLVHQEILLAPHLTVAQNVFLGRETKRGFLVNDRQMNADAAAMLRNLGVALDPRSLVETLSIANRQLVQIARALSGPHDFIIFDEPTATLTPPECEALFKVIEKLKASGAGIIYISHKLDEVKRLADQVSVLRDGKLVAAKPASELKPVDMAHLMVGRELGQLYPKKQFPPHELAAFSAATMVVPGFVKEASFHVQRGEILGFAGLIGAGRTELFEGILGLRKATGRIICGHYDGKPFASPKAAASAGLAYVTEDRKGKGLLLDHSLASNLTLATLQHFTRGGLISRSAEQKALDQAFKDFDIRAKSKRLDAGRLSGGNQQKLLLAKTLLADPHVIIIDEPTRGVDIGAKQQIYELIARLAREGKSVIVISSEMQELIGTCHRICVMHEGVIAGELTGEDMTERNIVTLATGTRREAA